MALGDGSGLTLSTKLFEGDALLRQEREEFVGRVVCLLMSSFLISEWNRRAQRAPIVQIALRRGRKASRTSLLKISGCSQAAK
jgi:hypothetical protein